MAKSRNNLLGVGGQRKKLSRADQHGNPQGRSGVRRTADDQKKELLRKMRERGAQATDVTGPPAEDAGHPADPTGHLAEDAGHPAAADLADPARPGDPAASGRD
ncbi:DUF6243 family protein [Streptomyces sp. NPDC094049]|uniref:DUF6243 family protein n=1 Tax=Streptomyces sp. NPDC094049 TaxID=3154987 RepID=UPI00331FF68D